MHTGKFTVVLFLALACAMPAMAGDGDLAGPIWGEGPEENGSGGSRDAGATVSTSQDVASPLAPSTGGTLTRISGRTSSSILQPDLVDLFEINITSTSFLADTNGSSFNTVLFLFRKVIDADGTVRALPVVMNDDALVGVTYSKLASIPGLTAGPHFIGVAKAGALPVGFKLNDNDIAPLFTYSPNPTAQVYPAGTLATYSLTDWINLGEGGDYQINLTGAVVRRKSTCDDAIVLGPGSYSFGNAGASDVGALRIGLGELCGDDAAWIANPGWFQLDACDGLVSVGVCPSSAGSVYQLVVYTGACGDLEPVACGVLGTSCSGGIGATASFLADPCRRYLVAFGPRRESGASPTSAGTLVISCTPSGPSCGQAGSGSCFTAHSSPTCDSDSCCAIVCALDAFCCNSSWDNLCVQQAYASCAPPPACPPSDPDLDGNGIIDGGDLAILLSQWGT